MKVQPFLSLFKVLLLIITTKIQNISQIKTQLCSTEPVLPDDVAVVQRVDGDLLPQPVEVHQHRVEGELRDGVGLRVDGAVRVVQVVEHAQLQVIFQQEQGQIVKTCFFKHAKAGVQVCD